DSYAKSPAPITVSGSKAGLTVGEEGAIHRKCDPDAADGSGVDAVARRVPVEAAPDDRPGHRVGFGADSGITPGSNSVVGRREIAVGGQSQVRSELIGDAGPHPALEDD